MVKDLEWLIKLQKLDSQINEITKEARKSESLIIRLTDELEENNISILKIEKAILELTEVRDETATGIEDQERLLEQKKADLQNDKKTKKEHIRREILKLEQAVKVFGERKENLEEDISENEQKIVNLQEKIKEIKKIVTSEEKKVKNLNKNNKKNLADLNKEREQIVENIRLPFYRHYERIKNIRNGVAVTFVTEDGLCNGCKVHIPMPSRQIIFKMDDYNICEGCGRILVTKDVLIEDENLDN